MFVTAVCVLFLVKLRWPKKKEFLCHLSQFICLFICQSTFLSHYFSALNIFQGFSLNFARTLVRQLLNGSRVIHSSSLFLESKA